LKKELIAVVREVIGPIASPDVIHWAPGELSKSSCCIPESFSLVKALPVHKFGSLSFSRQQLVMCRSAKDALWQDHAADPAQDS
jgi:hypothetical protein